MPASDSYLLAKAFNCYKGPDKDRQVIDRRGRNWAEARLCGPSLFIPVGPMLGMLEVEPFRQTLLCAATDRKDFYHQLAVSQSKAASNALGPALPRFLVESTAAFAAASVSQGRRASLTREQRGDCLKEAPPDPIRGSLLFDKDHYLVCFKAVAQGDHLGVEVATCAHGNLLEEGGLLGPGSNKPFKGDREAQGLVIDDYFSVCVHDLASFEEPLCTSRLARAKKVYASQGLAGSDDKDIVSQPSAKIAAAEICSTPFIRSLRLTTVAAPAQKRAALALVSLASASLSHTSDALHLCLLGGWTATLLFRRPLMSILASAHSVVSTAHVDSRKPVLCPLPRPAAQELALLGVLSPLAQCDLAAPMDPVLYASDASEDKGGFVKASAPLPLAYVFDFVEIYSGSGRVSKAMRSRGWGVGPSIDIGESPAFNMEWLKTLEWVLHLLQNGRLRSFLVAPPCTTFSPAAHPACRSYALPTLRRPRRFSAPLWLFALWL